MSMLLSPFPHHDHPKSYSQMYINIILHKSELTFTENWQEHNTSKYESTTHLLNDVNNGKEITIAALKKMEIFPLTSNHQLHTTTEV